MPDDKEIISSKHLKEWTANLQNLYSADLPFKSEDKLEILRQTQIREYYCLWHSIRE